MLQVKAKLIYNKKVDYNYFHCALETASIARNALPGQFVNVKLTETFDPLLRRPFSIHRARGKTIEIIYEVVGRGSAILSQKKAGEYLDIIGPLGNGFNCLGPRTYNLEPILIAGGMGVAPLMFLAQTIVTKSVRKPPRRGQSQCASLPEGDKVTRKPLVLLGAKSKNHILCEEEFKKLGCQVKVATDDGSRGFKGTSTELLKNILRAPSTEHQAPSIYACGPRPMLEEISSISKNYKIPAQISLEEHMACGIGACLGCAVDTKRGFKRACKEGPVFLAEEIIW